MMSLLARSLRGALAAVCAAGALSAVTASAARADTPLPDFSIGTSPVSCDYYRNDELFIEPSIEITVPVTLPSQPASYGLTTILDAKTGMYEFGGGAGGSRSGPRTFYLPIASMPTFAGAHSAVATVEDDSPVADPDETNNQVTVNFTLPARPPAILDGQRIRIPCTAVGSPLPDLTGGMSLQFTDLSWYSGTTTWAINLARWPADKCPTQDPCYHGSPWYTLSGGHPYASGAQFVLTIKRVGTQLEITATDGGLPPTANQTYQGTNTGNLTFAGTFVQNNPYLTADMVLTSCVTTPTAPDCDLL